MDRAGRVRPSCGPSDDICNVYAAQAMEHGLSESARRSAGGTDAGVNSKIGADLMRDAKTTNNAEGVARRCALPNKDFDPAWTAIKVADGVRERLLAQSLLSFTVRQKLPFESAPLHGLILLTGAPGTGKTTLSRGR